MTWRWTAATVAVVWAALGAAYLAGLQVHPVVVPLVAAATVVGTVALHRHPPAEPAFALVVPEQAQPLSRDRRLAQLTWQLRTSSDPARWRDRVRPALVDHVRWRLATHHGLDVDDDADRPAIRELVAPQVWTLLTDPDHTPRDTATLVDRIHDL